MSKKARERRARKLRRLTIGALCGVIAVVLLIVGIRSGARLVDIKQTLDRGDGVFYPNIYVNDIPLQGKTLDEAGQLTNAAIAEELALPPVKIHCSILAEDAIKAAINDYRNKQSKE